MDLPFAVDSSPDRRSTSLHHSNASSLVTASSQGSLLPDNGRPEHSSYSSQEQSPYSNTIIAADADMNDFTYVNVCETDEVDVIMDGQVPSPEDDTTRGDILAVLLSGGTQRRSCCRRIHSGELFQPGNWTEARSGAMLCTLYFVLETFVSQDPFSQCH